MRLGLRLGFVFGARAGVRTKVVCVFVGRAGVRTTVVAMNQVIDTP